MSNRKFSSIILLMLSVLSAFNIMAQQRPALIDWQGSEAPAFSLKVYSPEGKQLGTKTNRDYLGKWLILDLWTSYCIVCISGMPKLHQLQQQFADQLNILLVGNNKGNSNIGIEELYRRIAGSEKLRLQHAFDSDIFKTYQVWSVPYVAIIRPDGKIEAITSSAELSAGKLSALFAGKKTYFAPLSGFSNGPAPEPAATTLPEGLLGKRKLQTVPGYASELSLFEKGSRNIKFELSIDSTDHSFQVGSTTMERLYMLAYLGKCNWKMEDSSYYSYAIKPLLRDVDTAMLHQNGKGLSFNYRLVADAPVSRTGFMEAMQKDLTDRFGYRGRWTERSFTFQQLVVTDSKLAGKLRSTATTTLVSSNSGYISIKKGRTTDLLAKIGYQQQSLLLEDGSRLDFAIDIELQVPIINLAAVKSALASHGLGLVPKERKLKVLEIYRP